MNQEKIDRINELARKAKSVSLSKEELAEQKKLRQEYIESVKKSLIGSIENIRIVDENGNEKKVTKREK